MSVKILIEVDGKQTEIEMSDDAWRALTSIIERNRISPQEAIVRALENEDFIEQQAASGRKLLVAKGDDLRELVFA